MKRILFVASLIALPGGLGTASGPDPFNLVYPGLALAKPDYLTTFNKTMRSSTINISILNVVMEISLSIPQT
jgi:hypothetical protein